MNCQEARFEIASTAGPDSVSVCSPELLTHLADCPACRDANQSMALSLDVLKRAAEPDFTREYASVWPEVERVLAARAASQGTRQFQGWVASVAVAASVLAMIAIAQNLDRPEAPAVDWAEYQRRNLDAQSSGTTASSEPIRSPQFAPPARGMPNDPALKGDMDETVRRRQLELRLRKQPRRGDDW